MQGNEHTAVLTVRGIIDSAHLQEVIDAVDRLACVSEVHVPSEAREADGCVIDPDAVHLHPGARVTYREGNRAVTAYVPPF